MIYYVPTQANGASHYRQTTSLGGKSYDLRFDWNGRESRWMLSIYDANNAILEGVAVVGGVDLLAYTHAIPGSMYVVDLQAAGDEPGLRDFSIGRGYALIYAEPDE